MIDLHARLRQLHRPALLTRAARFAVDDYRRSRDLPRLLGDRVPAGPAPALMELLEIEKEINAERLDDVATYGVAQHVLILAAIMAEARDLSATRPGLI